MKHAIVADRHRSEYLIHKYWARKPANVIRQFITAYTQEGHIVLDPFCGSGVSVIEALRLGREGLGIDVNPIAYALTSVSTQPLDHARLKALWESVLADWTELCNTAYATASGKIVSHCVHSPAIVCTACGLRTLAEKCEKKANRHLCPECSRPLNTSIARAEGTECISVYITGDKHPVAAAESARQTKVSRRSFCDKDTLEKYDAPLLQNTRILSYPGMSTGILFTPRNFSLLASLADRLESLDVSSSMRNALFLIFTSGVASCSRLIPFRGNMSGGGPAWTVPGFWVPPVHLERNPALHMKARGKKVVRGLCALASAIDGRRASVYLDDSLSRLRELVNAGVKVDYIIADPPYGDSVPYLEFSQIWNCWLPSQPLSNNVQFDREVVVSDRVVSPTRWTEYTDRMRDVFTECASILKRSGHMTVTFNNLRLSAWSALLEALQSARFRCESVVYQIPAVVSAKASFAPTSSYVGDIYATVTKAPAGFSYANDDVVHERLQESARLRGGAVSRVTQLKVAAMTILEENVVATSIAQLNAQLNKLPKATPEIPASSPLFERIQRIAEDEWTVGRRMSLSELCAAIVNGLPTWVGLDQHEISSVMRRTAFVKRKPEGHQSFPG